MQPEQPDDYDKPVAYDNQGRPLYTHPPSTSELPVIELPKQPVLDSDASSKLASRHQASVSRFPDINLSTQEYVIDEVTRHTIGLVIPVLVAVVLSLFLLGALSSYPRLAPNGNPPFSSLLLPVALLLGLIALATYIVIWTYRKNRFFITNESIIQQVQDSLFAHNEKTVDLAEVKDISYAQAGIMQMMFNYGSIKITTEGGDEIYTFTSVAEPKKVVTLLNSVLEDFKNGRIIAEPSMFDQSV
jgi:uncharacterized membrane protein YdbT with pleckstrin-like domain